MDVQRAVFSPPTRSIPCLSCEAFYQPAHDIGGDYYDFLSLQGERWGTAIGDVSGKGIGATFFGSPRAARTRLPKSFGWFMCASSEDVSQSTVCVTPAHCWYF